MEATDIDLVLFCGDAFKTRTPSPTLVREFARRISLMAQMCPVVLVPGNHDIPGAFGKAHTLEIFKTLQVGNVHVANRPGLLSIDTHSGTVQVVAVPWPTRHFLMAQEKTQGLSVEEIHRLIAQAVEDAIEEFARRLRPELPTVLAGHLSVFGGTFGSERSVVLGGDVVIPLEAVARPCFDYVALGHLHRHQVLYTSPAVVYSGSTERIDFGEEAEEKGFMVVEIGAGDQSASARSDTHTEFVRLETREFLTIKVTAHVGDVMGAVTDAIAAHDLGGKVVRLVVDTTAEGEALLDEAEIQKQLGRAFRVASVTKNVEKAARIRLGQMDYEEMGPLELLRAYLESKGTPDEDQDALLGAAQELMTEGEQS